jgi:hypothetical protein
MGRDLALLIPEIAVLLTAVGALIAEMLRRPRISLAVAVIGLLVATGLTRNGTFLIEDGAVSGAVGNLRFTQSFVDALGPGAVLGVGDDDRYADGEFGAGVVICPSLHLAGWNFTGGAGG